jgi:hypothetical protein
MLRARLLLLGLFPLSACNCDDELGQLNGALEVDPPALDFGMVPRDLAKELPLKLYNRGSFVLNVEGYSADAPFIPPSGTSSIGTGNKGIEIKVAFKPSELGPVSGTLVIVSDDPKAPTVTVPLTGVGIEAAIRVEPSLIDFGEVEWLPNMMGQQSQTVTVSNPGSDAFELTALELTESANNAFGLSMMDAIGTYGPGASKTFAVTFLPNSRGAVSGSVRIATTTRMAPEIIIPLRGQGVAPEMELCALADSGTEACNSRGEVPRVTFGNIERMGMATGRVTVRNTGDRNLVLAQVFTTSNATDFTYSPAVPSTAAISIAPGATEMWTVTYTPSDYLFDAVLLGFATNDPRMFPGGDPRGSRAVDIRGGVKSARIRIQPGSLTFSHTGAVNHGETPVRFYNCGEELLTLSGNIMMVQTSGPEPALSITGAPPSGTTIPPQPMCDQGPAGAEMRVVFDTTTDGIYEGEIAVSSNDPTNPTVTVSVTATKR